MVARLRTACPPPTVPLRRSVLEANDRTAREHRRSRLPSHRHRLVMRVARFSFLLLVIILAAALPAAAQVGATTDIIMGKGTGPTNEPIANARVEGTSNETGITRPKTPNDKGEFPVLFPTRGR